MRHQKIANQAVAQFQQAFDSVAGFQPRGSAIDTVLEFLHTIAQRVESETTEGATFQDGGVPNLATAVNQGAIGHPTEDYQQLEGMMAISLQWDLDPNRAARLLAEADG
ncbi:hypothetical protein PJ985_02535 [Streptomyces sp. ACA25]|uniref:hypothetical protein n=1 Tax=Streptomyces sp. ACA25 TaxID=3022596 RepID=UPI00230799A2|nr:hypothetical protein [Streptomyces sp. ACA25]MDB1086449.1 hypothetical protein [Streptomyces sp. ACA25]